LVVARVGDVPITAADVAAQMAASPGIGRRRALEDRIVFELLAQEAARHDLPPDTVDQHAALVAVEAQRLVERDIEPRLTREAISDADVRALYERGRPRFVHGRLVETAVVHVFTGARMKDEPRARSEQNARLMRAALDQHPPRTLAELEAFVQQKEWIDRKVGLTKVWQDVDGDQPFPAVVARALRSLSTPGALTPLVGDETGYYVAMYLSERPAENRTFAEVAPGLRAEMYEPWRRQRFMRLATELTAGHDIEANPDLLTATPPP
ncbi:MAG TPA: peptidylprolyl isomerase, partial [Polyangia bacterium]